MACSLCRRSDHYRPRCPENPDGVAEKEKEQVSPHVHLARARGKAWCGLAPAANIRFVPRDKFVNHPQRCESCAAHGLLPEETGTGGRRAQDEDV